METSAVRLKVSPPMESSAAESLAKAVGAPTTAVAPNAMRALKLKRSFVRKILMSSLRPGRYRDLRTPTKNRARGKAHAPMKNIKFRAGEYPVGPSTVQGCEGPSEA